MYAKVKLYNRRLEAKACLIVERDAEKRKGIEKKAIQDIVIFSEYLSITIFVYIKIKKEKMAKGSG
nr:hypothetical protein [Chryseobacterium sp. SORGH_AS_0447]